MGRVALSEMAGVMLFGNRLAEMLAGTESVTLRHRPESAKVLPPPPRSSEPRLCLLVDFRDTSAAAAQGIRMATILQAEYPNLWPETIRALLIHSAEWTDAMKGAFGTKRGDAANRLRDVPVKIAHQLVDTDMEEVASRGARRRRHVDLAVPAEPSHQDLICWSANDPDRSRANPDFADEQQLSRTGLRSSPKQYAARVAGCCADYVEKG
jgi:hypothetical protein